MSALAEVALRLSRAVQRSGEAWDSSYTVSELSAGIYGFRAFCRTLLLLRRKVLPGLFLGYDSPGNDHDHLTILSPTKCVSLTVLVRGTSPNPALIDDLRECLRSSFACL